MPESVSKSKFKAHALEYFRQVQENGEPVVITDRGRPVLKLVPYKAEAEQVLRILRGSVVKYEQPTAPVAIEKWEARR